MNFHRYWIKASPEPVAALSLKPLHRQHNLVFPFCMIKLAPIFVLILIAVSSVAAEDVRPKDAILDIRSSMTGGDFELLSSKGKISLDQLRGKVVLLYFGYTKCPDVCPTTLATISQALNELSKEELNLVQALFISVDPERDSYELLENYTSYFHDNIIGVTGSNREIDDVAKRYGAQYEKVDLDDSSFGYAINHSSGTYLITPEGELGFVLPHQTPSFVILEAIKYLLTK